MTTAEPDVIAELRSDAGRDLYVEGVVNPYANEVQYHERYAVDTILAAWNALATRCAAAERDAHTTRASNSLLQRQLTAARAQVAALEANAKRWQWLRMQPYETFTKLGWATWAVDESVAERRDQQIDAARSPSPT
jgi:hypothetical protein